MPFNPEQINKAIAKSDKMKFGEEGVLRSVTLNNERYFAKQWRGKHYSSSDGKIGPTYEIEDWKTPVSPFWFKLKYYEAKLIHAALPDLTLKIPIGYDPRISKDGKTFDFQKGRPVTVTENVKGDPTLRQKRDDLIDDLYDWHFLSQPWDTVPSGMTIDTKSQYDTLVRWGEVDSAIRKEFGAFLDVRRHIGKNTFINQQSIDQFVTRINQDYEGTPIQRMVLAGVIPTHAEVNYIPTEETGTKQTKGIFLETSVFDFKRLAEALLEQIKSKRKDLTDPEIKREKKKIEDQIKRYLILRKLDDIWDEVYYVSPYAQDTPSMQWNSEVATALFKVLNSLVDDPTKEDLLLKNERIPIEIILHLTGIRYTHSKEISLENIKELETYLKNVSASPKNIAGQ